MTPEETERVSELFEAALERDPTEREAFLEEACDDEEVRAEVESLLEEHERAGNFVRGPALGDLWPSASRESLASAIGDVALRKISERYDILAEISRGGMGVVCRARDRETGELVALKILKSEIAGESEVMERFKRELLLARKITHKNVCRVHDWHRFDSTVVIAMEHIDGESLRAILDHTSGVQLRRALEWGRQICEALEEAHAQGVIHRDLKPGNVLIDRDGQVRVIDFGIARSMQADRTGTAARIGTPAYMSPEQAQGKPADARSDIYALGLVMYEMFTGRRAFQGDDPIVLLSKQVNEVPPSPRDCRALPP